MIVTVVAGDVSDAKYTYVDPEDNNDTKFTMAGDILYSYRINSEGTVEQVWRMGTVNGVEDEELIAERATWNEELQENVIHPDFFDSAGGEGSNFPYLVALGWSSTWVIDIESNEAYSYVLPFPFPLPEWPLDQQSSDYWHGLDTFTELPTLASPLLSSTLVTLPNWDLEMRAVWHGVVTAQPDWNVE